MLTSGKIQRSIQRFTDYASDLLQSDMNTFDDRLNLLMHFCETDEVFAVIHGQLMAVPVDFEKWFQECRQTEGSMAGSGALTFPPNIDHRLALMYQLLRAIWKDQQTSRLAVLNYAHPFFATGSTLLDSYISAFNDAVTMPLCRELGYRLDDTAEQLPADKKAEVPVASIQIIHHAQNVIQQNAHGTNINQTATQNVSTELDRLFSELRKVAVEAASLEQKNEVAETVDAAQELAQSKEPKVGAIQRLLKTLPPVATVLSITASILKIFG